MGGSTDGLRQKQVDQVLSNVQLKSMERKRWEKTWDYGKWLSAALACRSTDLLQINAYI